MDINAEQFAELRNTLIRNLYLDSIEDAEIEHILREIDSYDPRVRQKILALSLALSHASSSLVPAALRNTKTASRFFPLDDLDLWVTAAFDLLDSHGMDRGLEFLSSVTPRDLAKFQSQEAIRLSDTAPLLETYLRAMSGRELKIGQDDQIYTDTVTLYLPGSVKRFAERQDNFLLYKLSAAYAWAQLSLGTLTADVDIKRMTSRFSNYPLDRIGIDALLNLFPERDLSLDLYTIIDSFRIDAFLRQELPGLMKEAAEIKNALYQERQKIGLLSEKAAFVEGLWQFCLAGKTKGPAPPFLMKAIAALSGLQPEHGPEESVRLLFDFYDVATSLSGEYTSPPVPLFMGKIRPEKISARRNELKDGHRKKLESIITKLTEIPDLIPERHPDKNGSPAPLLEPSKEYLLIKGKLLKLDEELKSIIEEKGGIPGSTLIKGSDMGAGILFTLVDPFEEEETGTADGGLKYDEWDYKRGGYKKGWCTLFEHDMYPGDKPFVGRTLKRYSGYVTVLRKKFELLKRERRLQRRQKDGDEIDFDAAVACFVDGRAGASPCENIYNRTDRQERSIAVLFLLDMSGSTRGWVNQAEKESLVLMIEALETLGDLYAVYGFSGMTRNRCDLYRVKGFNERYNDIVKSRIAGITTKDYTRMGPFIRHSSSLLKIVEARTRLLITLSDGKPEDWDGYKGDYGVEDTRKALIEARMQGIHPFCITIDHEAQTYLPHMFGRAGYVFIDDVRKLPSRITEIYQRLTA